MSTDAPSTTVLTDLEAMMDRVSDPLTVIKGSVGTVLLHWESLDENDRRDLLAQAALGVDRVMKALNTSHVSPQRRTAQREEESPGHSGSAGSFIVALP